MNDIIYMRENDPLQFERFRTPRIEPGYYNIDSLGRAIQDAMNLDTSMPGTDTVSYNQRLARYEFSNTAQRLKWYVVIYSNQVQMLAEETSIETIPKDFGQCERGLEASGYGK